jgi:2-C-methyl-D-erythritol 4-phosphate cytidylyltransferase/2-C-methyl-D-erythritol 2,4-cyclodiphosphate synthase
LDRSVWVIIPAAGQGVRASTDVPKQFTLLGDSTVLETTVNRFLKMPEVAGVIVALPPSGAYGRGTSAALRVEALGTKVTPVLTVSGGKTRQESVMNALSLLPQGATWVAVHDAVRPFFSPGLFRRVFEACMEHGAAVPGISPADTVKRLVPGEMRVAETLDRKSLLMVQTPQVFDRETLVEAYMRAFEDGFEATDDSQLIERLGIPVAVVPGERDNIKLTYPEDFRKVKDGREASERVTVTGIGFDVHPFAEGRPCVIGGVTIPFDKGLEGHSDADVLVHAAMDAILGGLTVGDIGQWFPPGDPKYRNACSLALLKDLWLQLSAKAEVVHLDSVIVAEAPKIAPFAALMRANIASALGISVDCVSIKATTSEKMGFTGRGEGIAAFCTATLKRETTAG